ncbi:hypothetical protein [Cryobacterium serini]|uniref:Uncharacterized protein n=1 Tax=Cryobacterium serini TaxID=1259201 RepID=A0A4R9BKI0_9MICO|nr:hypothetical protein [Cryobacterium serini]TFD86120.1 hypothetical protein E3T51_13365 [Cryobacterium serini]
MMNSDVTIVMGRELCYRCLQPRTITLLGHIVRFECPDPACNEVLWLIRTKSQKAVKERAAAGLPPIRTGMTSSNSEAPPAPLTLVPPLPEVERPPRQRRAGAPHLKAVPPLDN